MTVNPTLRWLRPRLEAVPAELADDIVRLLEDTPGADHADPVNALAEAALAGLAQVADGSGERQEALRLLAADAALTYAFEAAAERGISAELASRIGLRGEMGRRLRLRVRPGGETPSVEGT